MIGKFRIVFTYRTKDIQRHFERTGFEPYFGMLEWMIDVAEKRKHKIHWLPDETGTCADCELNR